MNVYKCDCFADGSVCTTLGIVDQSGFDVYARYWVDSEGGYIRYWTTDELIKCDPKEKRIIQKTIDGKHIDVVAHCVEAREYYAKNKDGAILFSYLAWKTY